MDILKYLNKYILFVSFILLAPCERVNAEIVVLTADSVIEIAMENGYRFKMLELARKRNMSNINSQRAALKSKIYMNLKTPEYSTLSDYKWNSTLYMNEIIRTNTRRWQMDLSLRQPVIIMGYPTNGYLSLNNTTYKYIQKEEIGSDVDYFNRFFLKFEQPFFNANSLKNNIEDAELNLKIETLQDVSDKVNEIIGVASSYNNLLELVYMDSVLAGTIDDLNDMLREVKQKSGGSSREVEEIQLGLELKNANETRLNNTNQLRDRSMRLKQRIRLGNEDSLIISHDIRILPIDVDLDDALEHGYSLSPRLRQISFGNRKVEIDLDNARGNEPFHLHFEASMGLENNDDIYRDLWDKNSSSYSVMLRAYLPIWDWGLRKANIEAAEISVKRAYLNRDQVRDEITNDIVNAVENFNDYRDRVLAIGKNLEDARQSYEASVDRYRQDELSVQGVFKAMERKMSLEINYLEAYIRYRGSLLRLNALTFFEYESGTTMYERYNL